MKVRLKVTISGSRDGKPWPQYGSVVDLPADEAAAMCQTGSAEPYTSSDDDVETRPDAAPAETRTPLTTHSAGAVVPGDQGAGAGATVSTESPAPDPATAPAPKAPVKTDAPAKKAVPAKKNPPAKKAAAPSAPAAGSVKAQDL